MLARSPHDQFWDDSVLTVLFLNIAPILCLWKLLLLIVIEGDLAFGQESTLPHPPTYPTPSYQQASEIKQTFPLNFASLLWFQQKAGEPHFQLYIFLHKKRLFKVPFNEEGKSILLEEQTTLSILRKTKKFF